MRRTRFSPALCLAFLACAGAAHSQQLEVPFGEFASAAVDYAPAAYSLQGTLGQTFATVAPPTNADVNLAYAGFQETAVKFRYLASGSLLDFLGSPNGVPVEVRFWTATGTEPSDIQVVSLNAASEFVVNSWANPSKIAFLSAKPIHWLRQRTNLVNPSDPLLYPGASYNWTNGDVDNDNDVDFDDFVALANSYELPTSDPVYNPNADLDGDLDVDFDDFVVLANSYETEGDE